MKNFIKGKLATAIILLATFVLAGIAVFTAIRLYQLRAEPVAPNVPSSRPQAHANPTSTPSPAPGSCSMSFTIILTSPSATPKPTKTPTPTPTPVSQCNDSCGSSSDCPTGLTCTAGKCRNPVCSAESSCVCATSTPNVTASPSVTPTETPTQAPGATPTITPTPTATSLATSAPTPTSTQPALPQSGTDWPTMFGIGIGIITIIGSLILAL